jgi:transposase
MSVNEPVVYVAFELGKAQWKLALTTGLGIRPMVRTIPAGDLAAVTRVVAQAQARFGVGPGARVLSCYEAGRDAFWVHRALTALGIANRVVDSASIEVDRRSRRTKTDRLDAVKLVLMLVRACSGDPRVWHEVRVPSEAVEAARHESRERTALTREATRLRNQISGWLATVGCRVSTRTRGKAGWWRQARTYANAALAQPLQARIARAEARLQVVREQLAAIEAAQAATVDAAAPTSALARLVAVKGIATTSASVLLAEGLVWREFANRRQIGGLLGFAPTVYQSGETSRGQGIRRAGNRRLQSVMVQLAWSWIRWQPHSGLTQWFHARFGHGTRARKVGIVALARKLLIALWRYATQGVCPAGAVLKRA